MLLLLSSYYKLCCKQMLVWVFFYKIIEHHLAVHFHFRKLSSWKWQKANKGWGLYEAFYVRDAILGHNFLFYREKRKTLKAQEIYPMQFSLQHMGIAYTNDKKVISHLLFIFTGLQFIEPANGFTMYCHQMKKWQPFRSWQRKIERKKGKKISPGRFVLDWINSIKLLIFFHTTQLLTIKTGSNKTIYWLGRCSFFLGFIKWKKPKSFVIWYFNKKFSLQPLKYLT